MKRDIVVASYIRVILCLLYYVALERLSDGDFHFVQQVDLSSIREVRNLNIVRNFSFELDLTNHNILNVNCMEFYPFKIE